MSPVRPSCYASQPVAFRRRFWRFAAARFIAAFVLCVVTTSTYPAILDAQSRVYVRGYFRKDGTYVRPHYRTAPDGIPYNNYSFPGNYNPNTGEITPGNAATYLRNYYDSSRRSPALGSARAPRPLTAVQSGLRALGYEPGPSDGILGPRTATAVTAFQRNAGLEATGNLDLATVSALIEQLNELQSRLKSPDNLPANAQLNVYGNGWVCSRGFRRAGNGCEAVDLPANAQLNVYGNSWVCSRGFRRVGNGCEAVDLPAHAQLNVYGNGWVCNRGYRRAGNRCEAVGLPAHAQLNVYGNDWVCSRGYRRVGNRCESVRLPANAQLNVYGNDWVCSRGYRRVGNRCEAVDLPANAQLNVYGNDWVCNRGYRRAGNGCAAVEVPANARLNVYGNDWVCNPGYQRVGSRCLPKN